MDSMIAPTPPAPKGMLHFSKNFTFTQSIYYWGPAPSPFAAVYLFLTPPSRSSAFVYKFSRHSHPVLRPSAKCTAPLQIVRLYSKNILSANLKLLTLLSRTPFSLAAFLMKLLEKNWIVSPNVYRLRNAYMQKHLMRGSSSGLNNLWHDQ